MILTYSYRLLPSKRQHRALETLLEAQRQLYNAALEERLGAYRHGVIRTYFDQTKALTEWRREDKDASAIPANLQRATLKRLDEAYNGFFCRLRQGKRAGLPRFRGKGWWKSFGFRRFSGIVLTDARLTFKGMPGTLRVHFHRPLPNQAQIRSCTFCRDTKGWKVGFAVEVEKADPRAGIRSIGVDVGITNFATLSNGLIIPSIKAARRAERRLRIAQRSLSRKQRGSNNRRKSQLEFSRRHAAVARRRLNHLHTSSALLVRNYDLIAVERLNLSGLLRGRLARDVHDASWGRFISFLRYKAEKAGVSLIEVNAKNSSQDCSGCGIRVPKDLGERRHDCPHCGISIDRDLNAAINVLARAGVRPGLRNVAGCGMRAGGNLGSPMNCEPIHRASRDTTHPVEASDQSR